MLSVLMKIIYFAIVSIISVQYYLASLVNAKGRYVRNKGIMLCLLIFASHLLLLIPLEGLLEVALGIMQMILEFLLIYLMTSESIARKLITYVELNIILGISAITGVVLVQETGFRGTALYYGIAMALAVVLCSIRLALKKKDMAKNLLGRELTITLMLMMFCIMYVVAMAMYDIKSDGQIVTIYIIFALITLMVGIMLYINTRIQNNEELAIKCYVHSTIDMNRTALKQQMKRELDAYANSYEWILENIEKMYQCKDVDAVNRLLKEKQLIARNWGIKLDYKEYEKLPENVSVYDMVSLLGNLLDNAIRGVKNLEEKDRHIIVINGACTDNSSHTGIILQVQNKMASNISLLRDSEDNFMTTKEDRLGHGLGLKSVKDIAWKYGWSVEIEVEGGEFVVRVLYEVANELK